MSVGCRTVRFLRSGQVSSQLVDLVLPSCGVVDDVLRGGLEVLLRCGDGALPLVAPCGLALEGVHQALLRLGEGFLLARSLHLVLSDGVGEGLPRCLHSFVRVGLGHAQRRVSSSHTDVHCCVVGGGVGRLHLVIER